MIKILLLGSTGSIGTSVCNCVRRFKDRFSLVGLAAGTNVRRLCEQAAEFRPRAVHLGDAARSGDVRSQLASGAELYCGASGLIDIVKNTEYDLLLNALVGAVGFRPTVEALLRGKRVALANKESLVIGGEIIIRLLKEGRGQLLPVDSEHSAILQCLGGEEMRAIESIILTASGGPFRELPVHQFASITPERALKHPTWNMGRKITIDSATLINKGFEIIEAHHLFELPYDRLRVWIHPQSIIHSLVEFHDGAVIAQMGLPDMELPIQYALSYPARYPFLGKRLNLPDIASLTFFEPDFDRFPCLRLCIEAGRAGGTMPTVLNAANEVAVKLFLDGKIAFTGIPSLIESALSAHQRCETGDVSIIEEIDKETRYTLLAGFGGKGNS
jgi:1-deoxy-D-xylulose-5-phosphate reductoisomerase